MDEPINPQPSGSYRERASERAPGSADAIGASRITAYRRQVLSVFIGAGLMHACRARAAASGIAAADGRPDAKASTVRFRGTDFLHRWSKAGQHEFTPSDQPDLASWRDMVTLNVHEAVSSGEQLAGVANQVLGNYQRHGKILQTRSQPRTPARPAEHLIVAVLGQTGFLEAAFARCLLNEGMGMVAVYSHRVYGKAAGPAIGSRSAS